MHRRIGPVVWLALLLGVSPVLAEGSLSGHITVPEGTAVTDVRVVLVPENPDHAKRTVKPSKKGDFFFGLVPEGRYTLAIEGTQLVQHSISVLVNDTETHKDVFKYSGPVPSKPTPFDVSLTLKVTYDITLGPAEKSPQAIAAATQEIPGLLQAGDYAGALSKLDIAIEAKPDDPALHYWRAFALFKSKSGDMEKAKADLKRALEINPSQIGAHWVMGAILATEGKKPEAIEEFQKEIDNPATDAPTRLNAYINVGVIQRDLGNRAAAIAAFEKVLELDNKQSEAYSYLADLYLASGKPEKAEEIQAKGKALGVEDPKAIFNIGATNWNNKEYAKAESAFRRAVELDPKFALAWKSLGYALVNLGKTSEAAVALKKYLELAPDATDAKEVRDLVGALGQN